MRRRNPTEPVPAPMPSVPGAPSAANGATEPTVKGVFEPPSGFAVGAIARNKGIVLLFAIALAIAGVAWGALRSPTYTASATLQVGQVNPNSPGFLGYVQSASSLATAFSRSIAAAPVLGTVERKLGLPVAKAAPRLSAEPIPLSPAFRIIATGPSGPDAIRLANTTAAAVIAYEGHSNSANPEAQALLSSYQEASLALRQANAEISERASESSESTLRAEAKKSAAQVKLKAIETAYVAAVASQAPRQGLVSLVAGATTSTSDRKAKIELFGFVGLLVGAVLGCAAAVLRERRRAGPEAAALSGPEPA
jgi:uncharacterized protein involved in exopolysaccharide biosynthesis